MKSIANLLSLLLALALMSSNLMANGNQPTIVVEAADNQIQFAKSLIDTYNATAENKAALKLSIEASANTDLLIVDNNYLINNNVAWQAIMGRNALVPVISKKNPDYAALMGTGITVEQIKKLVSDANNGSMVVFEMNTLEHLKAFASIENLTNTMSYAGMDEFAAHLTKNAQAIGFIYFTNLISDNTYIYDQLSILPIDRNSNGRIDPMESFYESPSTFSRALWMGKYPQVLTSNVYLAGSSIPKSDEVKAAINGLLAMSQTMIDGFGYARLESHELKVGLNHPLTEAQTIENTEKNAGTNWLLIVVLFVVLLTVAGLIVTFLFGTKVNESSDEELVLHEKGMFNAGAVSAPAGLFYDKTHTWAFMENDGNVKVGIDDFLRNVLGKVNQVALKPIGTKVVKGETLAIIVREGKKISVKAPVSGVIIDRNNSLNSFDQEEELVKDWLYSIEPSNWKREIELLFMAESYRSWIEDEFIRLKDFLARSLQQHAPQFMPVVLQDGGELIEGFMSEMGPEIWEDFQTNFLDNAIFTKH